MWHLVPVKILVVEDDPAIAESLVVGLGRHGFEVGVTGDGAGALRLAAGADLVLLDLGLPDLDGSEVCRQLRDISDVPIIVVSARSAEVDRVVLLDNGADDYVIKPFDLEELMLRVHAVLRRARVTVERLVLGQVTIDFRQLDSCSGSTPLHLTRREYDMLQYLAERQGRVVTRDELLRDVWGYPGRSNTRSVDYAVARLRKKIEVDPHHPRFLRSAHGDGYCLTIVDLEPGGHR